MSVQAYSWALEQRTGDPLQKLVLLVVADISGIDHACGAPFAVIASRCEITTSQLLYALQALATSELIDWSAGVVSVRAPPIPSPPMDPVRAEIFSRDGHACIYCGSRERLELDHVVPRSRGGSNAHANLATCCRSCNASKGARTPEEWLS